MKLGRTRQRLLGLAIVLAVLASFTLVGGSGLAVVDSEILVNGSFEGGFGFVGGCGMVGAGWSCFTNGGTIDYGFYDDQWSPVVADGTHSQLIELNTLQYAASEPDRFAGISQAVTLVKGGSYQFKLSGLMRERNRDLTEDPFRYRVQWGYTADGSSDWTNVTNWSELSWDKIDERTAPTGMQSYSTTLVAPSDKLTLFVRAWKKWGTAYEDLEVNLDAISLFGPTVKSAVVPAGPIVILPGAVVVPTTTATASGATSTQAATCGGANYIANGDFESGFINGVAKGWSAFNNGGRANYGFYDEMWASVIKDGAHGQLIEINTIGYVGSDADRHAGIYQVVSGLAPGATYEFSLSGLMRERGVYPAEDAFRYRVQWGYVAADADPSQTDITSWSELSWDTIYERSSPGSLSTYSARFAAPSGKVVIAVRAWKKWGTGERELDVNLDAVKLQGCSGAVAVTTTACAHVVVRGETLGRIAARYGTTVAVLAELNRIPNPNLLYVGQTLSIPCSAGAGSVVILPSTTANVITLSQPVVLVGSESAAKTPIVISSSEQAACTWHTVVYGDTLYALAARYGTTLASIMEANRLANPNLIYVGQKLCM